MSARWQSQGAGGRVTIDVGPGFHVNEKAPNSLTILPRESLVEPALQSARSLRFDWKEALKPDESVLVSVYVCDDGLTVCENREWKWDSAGSLLKEVEGEASRTTSPRPVVPVVKDGFYQEALDVALKDCKALKKRVLLLFSARWCPGCIRLEQEVWSHAFMRKTLSEFVRVKLDADRFENKPRMKEYGVAGIPAVLVLNCEGEELGRVVDYLDRAEMKGALDVLAKKKLDTRAQLEKKASGGDATAALELAQRAAQSYQVEAALKWFALLPDRADHREYWMVRIADLAERSGKDPKNEKGRKEWQDALTAALRKFPRTMSSLDWRLSLARLQAPAAAQGTLRDLVKMSDELIADRERMAEVIRSEPSGDYLGIESLRVFQAKAEALEALQRPADALAAWKAAAEEGRRLAIREEPSGPYYRFLVILKKAGEHERLKRFFARHAALPKTDGELLRRYAKYLLEQGDYTQAVRVSERALKDSYGRNEVLAAIVHAQALGKMGKVAEAKQFLLKYQTRKDLTDDARQQIESVFKTLGS
ncbi:MAG: thioredoxin family protein [Bdellovibrionaceae bacterium]|nr:thioredoxin family protein [Pseudobdellovibrionaceae bacterium]